MMPAIKHTWKIWMSLQGFIDPSEHIPRVLAIIFDLFQFSPQKILYPAFPILMGKPKTAYSQQKIPIK